MSNHEKSKIIEFLKYIIYDVIIFSQNSQFWTVEIEVYLRTFGENLRQLRKAKGYSQQRLADESDVGFASIQRIENATMSPTLTTIVKLCIALQVQPKDLLIDLDFDG